MDTQKRLKAAGEVGGVGDKMKKGEGISGKAHRHTPQSGGGQREGRMGAGWR